MQRTEALAPQLVGGGPGAPTQATTGGGPIFCHRSPSPERQAVLHVVGVITTLKVAADTDVSPTWAF